MDPNIKDLPMEEVVRYSDIPYPLKMHSWQAEKKLSQLITLNLEPLQKECIEWD